MSDFAKSWRLSRGRFVETISPLSQEQLNWRLYPKALTIGQMALHVAGVEVSFGAQIAGIELNEDEKRLKSAATDGVVNDLPFPYSMEETTPELVAEKLRIAEAIVEPLMEAPSSDAAKREVLTVLGPTVSGDMALARLAFHSAYHQGQAYQIIEAPGFPK